MSQVVDPYETECQSVLLDSGKVLVRDSGRLAKVGVVNKLFQHEVGHIGTRDPTFDSLIRRWKAMPIDARSRAVPQVRRANNGPIQRALSYYNFLSFVIGESVPEENAHDDVPGKEGQVGSTIAHTKRGETNQSFHACSLHGLDDVSRSLLSKG